MSRWKTHMSVINILFNGIVWAIFITKAEWIIKQQISILNNDKHCVTYHPCFSAEEFPAILTINKSSILSLIYCVLLFQLRALLTAYQYSGLFFSLCMQKFTIPSYLLATCKPFLVLLR